MSCNRMHLSNISTILLLHVFVLSQLPGRGVEFLCGLLTCNMSTSNSSSVPIGDNILIKKRYVIHIYINTFIYIYTFIYVYVCVINLSS